MKKKLNPAQMARNVFARVACWQFVAYSLLSDSNWEQPGYQLKMLAINISKNQENVVFQHFSAWKMLFNNI